VRKSWISNFRARQDSASLTVPAHSLSGPESNGSKRPRSSLFDLLLRIYIFINLIYIIISDVFLLTVAFFRV
jgi:hypothetical protein